MPNSRQEQAVHHQADRTSSPWTFRRRLGILAWGLAWTGLCSWTPKPLYRWRNFVLRLAGAKVGHGVFVHQRAHIEQPWNIILEDECSIGDRTVLYSLGEIRIGRRAVIAQEAYLCTGTHDFDLAETPLITSPIQVGEEAFVGARAFVLPGVVIGSRAIIGAMAVCTKHVPSDSVAVGNPAKVIGRRERRRDL